jgi:hypothetical protein
MQQCIKQLLENPKTIFIYAHDLLEAPHERCIVDYAINFYLFYHSHGYYYLNYYPNKEKQRLVGVYNRFDQYKPLRRRMINHFRTKVDSEEDIHVFNADTPFTSALSCRLIDRWAWQHMHIASYTDYNSTVANILFETAQFVHPNFVFSEKTVKSLIFQEADIFFIYVGVSKGIEWLHEKGFWFLNSEFYDKDDTDFDKDLKRVTFFNSELPLIRSAEKTIEYLKTLKQELKTDSAVHAFLVEKYRDRLNSNRETFKKMLTNCEYKDRLLSLITNKQGD